MESSHALAMRLALSGLEDDLVGAVDCIAQYYGLAHQAAVGIHVGAVQPQGPLRRQFGHDLHGNPARHLARVVTTHAVGQDHEADVRIGADRVLVVLANAAGVGQLGELDFSTQVHCCRATALSFLPFKCARNCAMQSPSRPHRRNGLRVSSPWPWPELCLRSPGRRPAGRPPAVRRRCLSWSSATRCSWL